MATETQLLPPIAHQNTLRLQTTQLTNRPRIPVVSHVVTDEDAGLYTETPLPPINLAKVVKLLTDPHSAKLCERHIYALNKVIKHYKNGFLMKDLVLVFKILNVCADKVADVPSYVAPMSELLRLCSLPYLKEKTSDETSYEQIAIESTDQLGYLMRVPCKRLRLQICETLKNFHCTNRGTKIKEKYKPNSLTYNQSLVEKSDVAETLVKSLALVDDDSEIRLSVLDLLRRLSKKSASNCNKILKADGALRLCGRILDHDPTHKILFITVEILWNLLENGSRDLLSKQMNNAICISHLRDAFVDRLTQGVSDVDRQLRNDILVVVSLVASVAVEAPFVETGFAKQLALFASFEEVKSHNAFVKHLKLPPSSENFELKKLLINVMVLLAKNPAAIPILIEGRVLLALFSFVKSNEPPKTPLDWNPGQYEEIQLQAMAALSSLGPLMVDEYLSCQGGTRLLLLMEWCVSSVSYAGFGNGFYSVGGCGSKRAQMHHCIRLIRSMTSTYNEAVLVDLSEQGAINQLISVLEGFVSKRSEKKTKSSEDDEDAVDVEMQCDLLVILSVLCQHDIHRKELFGMQGVNVLVEYLKMDSRLLTSGLGHFSLLVSAINCTWCSVIGSYLTEDYFLEKEGAFLLLDLLESIPESLYGQILGCFLDLAENQKTLPHVGVWRGKKNISAPHLFCELWRQEEIRMGVRRDATGAISDTQKPLLSQLQDNQAVISLPANCPSQAIVDVSENLRAKVYAIFNKIGYVELPGLTPEDHITLTIIEHYLDLKMGEVWTEVISELAEERIRPITPDREALEAISTAINIRTDQVIEVQKELIDAQNQQDLIDEQEYFAEIRERHRLKEKASRDFADFMSRTSKYMILKTAKERQKLSIDASRVQTNFKASEHFHSTELEKLNITTFCGRNIVVESTPSALTGGLFAKYDPDEGTIEARQPTDKMKEQYVNELKEPCKTLDEL